MGMQVASVVSQQTPAAPQMPAAHSPVDVQAAPGAFFGWHIWVMSQ